MTLAPVYDYRNNLISQYARLYRNPRPWWLGELKQPLSFGGPYDSGTGGGTGGGGTGGGGTGGGGTGTGSGTGGGALGTGGTGTSVAGLNTTGGGALGTLSPYGAAGATLNGVNYAGGAPGQVFGAPNQVGQDPRGQPIYTHLTGPTWEWDARNPGTMMTPGGVNPATVQDNTGYMQDMATGRYISNNPMPLQPWATFGDSEVSGPVGMEQNSPGLNRPSMSRGLDAQVSWASYLNGDNGPWANYINTGFGPWGSLRWMREARGGPAGNAVGSTGVGPAQGGEAY